MEQPDAAEMPCECRTCLQVVDDLLVADGAAGLDDGRHAGHGRARSMLSAEGEERIRAEADAVTWLRYSFFPQRFSGSG